MTADPFIRAASDRALSIAMETFKPGFDPENHPSVYRLLVDMAAWARAHLAAQEPTDAESIARKNLGDDAVDRLAAHFGITQEPTDAEVEAAARALDMEGAVYAFNGDRAAAEADVKAHPPRLNSARGEELQIKARAALSAARAARRDEEKRDG